MRDFRGPQSPITCSVLAENVERSIEADYLYNPPIVTQSFILLSKEKSRAPVNTNEDPERDHNTIDDLVFYQAGTSAGRLAATLPPKVYLLLGFSATTQ